jgi:hypothetical protein
MPVMPWTVNSMRMLVGRLNSISIGMSMPPPTILPVMRMLWMPLIFSRPPWAWMFFWISSSAVWAWASAAAAKAASRQTEVLRSIEFSSSRVVGVVRDGRREVYTLPP